MLRPRGLLLLLTVVVTLVATALAGAWSLDRWRQRPLVGLETSRIVIIPPGESLTKVADRLSTQRVISGPLPFVLLARWQDASARLQAGEYELPAGASPQQLLDLFVAGDVVQHRITLVEGWTFTQALAAIRAHEAVAGTAAGAAGPPAIAAALGRTDQGLEGSLFPDTYTFPRGTTDLQLLRRAAARLDAELGRAWAQRALDLPFATPAEALVLATLVEKETSVDDERPLIAGVFVNRLRRGMRLQSDPTVIYGLGAAFDGDLRRADLRRDTPFNTYTRTGLPPTPIALPGAASLAAATRPAKTDALYFVATGQGDGRHRFATTLAEHNRNVAAYLATLRSSWAGRP
jgi:UPF0755 protein